MKNELNKFKKENPNIKIGEWNTEDVVYDQKSVDPDTGEITTTKEIAKKMVKYLHIPDERMRCPNSQHLFRVLDKGKWIFGCTKCQYSRIIYPGTKGLNIIR